MLKTKMGWSITVKQDARFVRSDLRLLNSSSVSLLNQDTHLSGEVSLSVILLVKVVNLIQHLYAPNAIKNMSKLMAFVLAVEILMLLLVQRIT